MKGVRYDKDSGKYQAQITVQGKKYALGRFDTLLEAQYARLSAEEEKEKGTFIKYSIFAGRYNIVSLGDWHVPYEDREAIKAALKFVEKLQPNIIVLHEVHDFYKLSRFDKDPDRRDNLQTELDIATGYFNQVRAENPDARIILTKSNHLDRLRRYLWANAQGLSSLKSLEIENLLNLRANNIEYMESLLYNNVLFKHGNLVSKEAGMTARRELQAEGLSGVSGHTHRLAQIYRRDRSGNYMWIEGGCLCQLQPEYIEGVSNWQHGFSIVSFDNEDSNKYFAMPVPIIDGEVFIC